MPPRKGSGPPFDDVSAFLERGKPSSIRVAVPSLSYGIFAASQSASGNLGSTEAAAVDSSGEARNAATPTPFSSTTRGASAAPKNTSEDILLDLMAYQRTFDGAYMRTALNELSYAVVILKLFQSSFYYIGLAMTLLALAFAVVAVQRSNLGRDNAKRMGEGESAGLQSGIVGSRHASWRAPSTWSRLSREDQQRLERMDNLGQSVPLDEAERQTDCHLHGVSHFKTAGNVVAFATLGALAVETAILCIILTM